MLRHLTENGYANTPPMLGEISRVANDGTAHTMIVAQRFVHNQGDAWQWTLNFLMRVNETMALVEKSGADQSDAFANYAAFARAIGTRLAQLHALLARPSDDAAFAPEQVTEADASEWTENSARQIEAALETLVRVKEFPDESQREDVRFLLAQQKKILGALPALAKAAVGTLKTRIHGDFHLGQVLFASGDAYIIDFEGEPAKSLEARRAKSCPVRDVAGLLRSFHYAAAAARINHTSAVATTGTVVDNAPQAKAAAQRFVDEMSAQFLNAYYAIAEGAAAGPAPPRAMLLDLFLLEKSAYEICYEAANRPTWLAIPLRGFTEIAARLLNVARETVDA
jgi:maltose alpha-D-glucosyltransferase/alpha-amylase